MELPPLALRLAKSRRVVLGDWLGFGTVIDPGAFGQPVAGQRLG
jgi:hypothetical protein